MPSILPRRTAPLSSHTLVHAWPLAVLLASAACSSPSVEPPPHALEVPPPDSGTESSDAAPDASSLLLRAISVEVTGLLGAGLQLELGAAQRYTPERNGNHTVHLDQPLADVELVVAEHPKNPRQSCEATKLGAASFAVTCRADRFRVQGSIAGLLGEGLTLLLQTGEQLVLEPGGGTELAFRTLLGDQDPYEVTIARQPSAPAQTCVLSNGSGTISGADAANLTVTCRNSYYLTTHVEGLLGAGLQVATSTGTVIAVPTADAFRIDMPLVDGTELDIDIAQQPANPAQRCYVDRRHVLVAGKDQDIHIICDALGNIRISEVGACPFSNSSCWFEVINVGERAENLAFYQLRTSAVSSSEYMPVKTFALPSISIPKHGTVVLQAKTAQSLPDGRNVFHVSEGDTVPWWASDGFVELLDPRGVTQDFVRFGESAIEPTTGGTWVGGAAPGLPRGLESYGYSVARLDSDSDTGRASDWRLSAFATYGGTNDSWNDADADKDGIPDASEAAGKTFAGVDVFAYGARPGKTDVFVEVDYMQSTDPAVRPQRAALDAVVAAFARRGIALHFDVGSLFAGTLDPSQYNLGGGNAVAFAEEISLRPTTTGVTDLYAYKSLHMAAERRGFFYYMLMANTLVADSKNSRPSGVGEVSGNDSIVALGGAELSTHSVIQRNLLTNQQSATIMHELGHNFGLRHGGGDALNNKPNYLSVMNYMYSSFGLPTVGQSEGDRYALIKKCGGMFSIVQLTNAPTSDPSKFIIDYSDGSGADLDERSVREPAGLGRSRSLGVDYNCNAMFDSVAYSRDLNSDNTLDHLVDNDDWGSLNFVFRRTYSGAENGNFVRLFTTEIHGDTLTNDTEHTEDEPCPGRVLD